MQIAMEKKILPEFPDFCRKKLWQKVLCNGALVTLDFSWHALSHVYHIGPIV